MGNRSFIYIFLSFEFVYKDEIINYCFEEMIGIWVCKGVFYSVDGKYMFLFLKFDLFFEMKGLIMEVK